MACMNAKCSFVRSFTLVMACVKYHKKTKNNNNDNNADDDNDDHDVERKLKMRNYPFCNPFLGGGWNVEWAQRKQTITKIAHTAFSSANGSLSRHSVAQRSKI